MPTPMDYLRTRRAYRLIPFGLLASCLLWAFVHFGVADHDIYPSGPDFGHPFLRGPPHPPHAHGGPPHPPPFRPPPAPQEHTKWSKRADAVRDAFRHAYKGYLEYAGSSDELKPVSNEAVNNFNGWRLTMVDSLDTMLIMGLHEEFYDTVPILANMTFALDKGKYAPFFETVIRYLGGLLSAYALSGEPILLARADDLGAMLLPAFNTAYGLPMYAVNTVSGETRLGWTGSDILWAEALSCQVEYKYLAHLTGRKEYFDTVERVMDLMANAELEDDMFPTKWSVKTGKPSNTQFSVGAFADSAHEYLLKQYLLTGQSESKALDLYLRDASAILRNLLYVSPTRGLLYVTDAHQGAPTHTFEHLSCFLPGLLALGAHALPPGSLSPRERELHAWAAHGLAHTCWLTYADSEAGLGPDEVVVAGGGRRWLEAVEEWEEGGREGGRPPGVRDAAVAAGGMEKDYRATKMGYLLRPETVESFYYLWRTTGDEVWRERGWAVFRAIEREAKTDSGYASLWSVFESPARHKDEMPSFFTAETLKYLYLLFKDEDLIPLDRWVFNTEAHPLPIFHWADWEKERYGIVSKDHGHAARHNWPHSGLD
ncbi:seven-hairpin glycosidase [Dichomitus squalens]|uniref:alpha-1,2-Mannosidase n=1 Tax=Dichomitus squalens TaxID=114155 RepID=A0A4Q9MUR6_9APHY|nr:seven-hairpin glycosidase [Dichomitus squalens]